MKISNYPNWSNWKNTLRQYRVELFILIICVFACALVNVIYPWLLKYLLDIIVRKTSISAFLTATLFIAFLYLIRGIFDYGRIYWSTLLTRKIAAYLREKLFYHIQRLPIRYYEKFRTGEVMSIITSDIEVIDNGIVNELIGLSISLLNVIGAAIFMVYIYWPLAFVSIIVIVLMVNSLRLLKLRVRELTSGIQDEKARLSVILEENISGIQLVKAHSSEDYETGRFNLVNDKILKISLSQIRLNIRVTVLTNFMVGLCFVFLLVFGGMEVIKGHLTLGTLIAFILYMQIVDDHMNKVITGYIAVQKISVAGKRIFNVLSEEGEQENVGKLESLPLIKGDVEFKNVVFSYERNDCLALRNIAFTVRAGESVALVGPNGAGKSTIIKLLFRFYDPNEGAIYIDGNDIRRFSYNSLRHQMAIVLQENLLFSGSISDNIAFGDNNPSYDRIVEAAKLANANDFIIKLPNGYNTYVGGRGVKLSGGQRQLIGIARAMYRNPRIMVLDEAFSYLDVNSEALIQESLRNVVKEKTVFIIAHRLSTIINSTKIIVINNGEIVGLGTHHELIQENVAYKKLYQNQLQNLYSVRR